MKERVEKTITRREVVSLAGVAAALGAGLGVAHSADASQEPGMIQDKHRASLMKFKFYSLPDAAGKQTLLGAIPVPAMLQYKFQQASGGRVQLKVELSSSGALLPAVQKPTILADSVLQFKQSIRNLPKP